MEAKEKSDATERVGKFEMAVKAAEHSGQSAERWAQRVKILSNWLLAQWQQEQEKQEAA